jgi:hypothetical protein
MENNTQLDPAIATEVQELVKTAFDKGVTAAIDQAQKLNNPAILDAFHDVLSDQLYATLLERKKLVEPQ